MSQVQGAIWQVSKGEISEIVQYRITMIGTSDYNAVFPIAFLSDQISVLTGVQVAALDALVKGAYFQGWSTSLDFHHDVTISYLDGVGAEMRFYVEYLADLINTLTSFQIQSGSLPAEDWDNSKPSISVLVGSLDQAVAGLIQDTSSLTEDALSATLVVRRRLVLIGNSITNYLNSDAADLKTKVDSYAGVSGGPLVVVGTPNYGAGGSTTDNARSRLDAMIDAEQPSIIGFPASANDVKTGGPTRAQTLAALRRMVGVTRIAGAHPVAYLDPPMNPVIATVTDPAFVWSSEYEKRIRDEIVRRDGLRNGYAVVDVPAAFARNDVSASPDGIHPSGTTTGGFGGIDVVQTAIAQALGCLPPTVWGWQYLLNTFSSSNDPAEASLGGVWAHVEYETSHTDHTAIATCTGPAATAYDASAVTRREAAGGHYLALLEVAANRSAALKFYKVAGQNPTQLATVTFAAGLFGDTAYIELASVGTKHTIRVGTIIPVTFEGSTFNVDTGLITTIVQTDATYAAGTKVGVERVGNPLTVTNLLAYY